MLTKTFKRTIPGVVAVVITLWLYSDTLKELVRTWLSDGNYAHGILVIPIALMLVYARRHKLAVIPVKPSLAGNAFLLVGLVLFLFSKWADVTFLGGLSLVAVVAGLVWTFAGWRMLKELAFPIAFLIFMTPPPDIFVERVGAPLQQLSCTYATMLGGLLGMDVRSEGVMFFTNGMNFAVDVPCSGIRAINALCAFTAVLAYLTSTTNLRRIGLFFLALPIAIISNVIRVFGVIAIANADVTLSEVMQFHDVSGPIVFLVAVGFIFLIKRRIECLV